MGGAGIQLMLSFAALAYRPLEYIELVPVRCWKSALLQLFNLDILKNPKFLLIALGIVLFTIGNMVPITFMVVYAESCGVPPYQAVLLVSWFGFGSTIGRAFMGFLADIQGISVMATFIFSMFTTGAATGLIFLYYSPTHYIIYANILGAFTGSTYSLFPVLLAERLGISALPQTFGMALLLQSTSFVGPPMAGYFIDIGDHDLGFIVGGV